jgi:hypothetical protein
MADWVGMSVELLRRLVGRLPDHTLASIRSLLGARERTMMTDMLLVNLVNDDVALDDEEQRLLDGVLHQPDALREDVPRATASAQLRYRFVPDHGPQTNPDNLNHVLYWVTADPQARSRRLRQARRIPADPGAPAPEGRVYTLEVAPGADVSGIQSSVQFTPGAVGVEVIAKGEKLPPYQAAALSAGVEIWPSNDTRPEPCG